MIRLFPASLKVLRANCSHVKSTFHCSSVFNKGLESLVDDVDCIMPETDVLVTEELLYTPPEHVKEIARKVLKLNLIESQQFLHLLFSESGLNFTEELEGHAGTDRNGGGNSMTQTSNSKDVAGSEATVESEKTAFKVYLKSIDPKSKLKIIKEVRATVNDLSLKDAKALVESAPCGIGNEMDKESAEKFAASLKELGAEVELK